MTGEFSLSLRLICEAHENCWLADGVKIKARDSSGEVRTGLAAVVLETRDSCHGRPMKC